MGLNFQNLNHNILCKIAFKVSPSKEIFVLSLHMFRNLAGKKYGSNKLVKI